MQKQEVRLVEYLTKYIEMSLEELRTGAVGKIATEFVCGETYAYIECLEIILIHNGADENALRELELKYGIS